MLIMFVHAVKLRTLVWFPVQHIEGSLGKEIIEKHFYPADPGVGTLLCGPPGLIEKAALPGLREMGFKDGKTVFGF